MTPSDRPGRLTRGDVLSAALALLNEVGIDALSTRRLAERLGVQSPTLYWHFKSKGALLDAMSEALVLEHQALGPPAPGEPWQRWLLADGHRFRKALLAYRDGARLHAGTRPGQAHHESIEARLRLLCDAGFEPAAATLLMMSIGRFVVGWVLEEQSAQQPDAPPSAAAAQAPDAARHPLLAAGWAATMGDAADSVFDRALRLLLEGAASQLGPEAASPARPAARPARRPPRRA